MTTGEPDAIGGYLPLELPEVGPLPAHLRGAYAFQSARAAFLALLQAVRPACVWLPWFLCDSMAEPLEQAGVPCRRYALDEERMPLDVALNARDLLLHVNNFGLGDDVQRRLASVLPPQQLVFDNAQAWFCPPQPVLATLYSPRKFLGVPDGGFLFAPGIALAPPPVADQASVQRSAHLLLRHAGGAEAGYAAYGQAEAGLRSQPPLRISRLTDRLLHSVDHDQVRRRRRENYSCLAAALGDCNPLRWHLPETGAPLCYPFLASRKGLRLQLAARRIYTPTYWPELLDGRPLPPLEHGWASRLLALPVDQRYDPQSLSAGLLAPLRELLTA